MKISLSIVIPVYNTNLALIHTLKNIFDVLDNLKLKKYEIIIINDCSYIFPNNLKKNFKKKSNKIKIIHNKKNIGFGRSLYKGFIKCKCDFITFYPSDNDFSKKSILKILKNLNKNYDLIVHYHYNLIDRGLYRFLISRLYTLIMNFLSINNLKYYNSVICFKKKFLPKKNFSVLFGHSYLSFCTMSILRNSKNYIEVGVYIRRKNEDISNAINLKNIFLAIKLFVFIFKKQYLKFFFNKYLCYKVK